MRDWFTVEAIDAETYAISEYEHWEETHCYLLLGRERALLIDTGLGVANIKAVVDRLTDLPVSVATTHAHWDHIGGHRHFRDIAVHGLERDWLAVQFPIPLAVVRKNLTQLPCNFPPDFNPDTYEVYHGTPQRLLRDGDRLDLGNREIQVIHTPGHSPGHCCFYESEKGYLFSGDLVYQGCLYAFYPTTDPLLFYQSIQRIQGFDVHRILPGHHTLQIPISLIGDIAAGFEEIAAQGKLQQGSGLFAFEGFQIQI